MPLDPPTSPTDARPLDPAAASRLAEIARVADEYSALLTARPLDDADRLIAEACVDPLWDERTNLLSFLADTPEQLGLVLSRGLDVMVVRYDAERGVWFVDDTPVDWEVLEHRAFDDDDPMGD